MDAVVQLNAALQNRYEIEREIGAGGMATVYLARDLRHDRKVALKVLRPDIGAVLGAERFLAEIKVTANLQHPNLLPLFDSGEADGVLFYVMPHVEGESLRGRLDREKQLPVDDAIHVAASVASALDYAHRHGVIHRDLKPENILLHEGQPLVADFGIALAISHAGGQRITQTGISLGTPQYMSPEQATGDRQIDGRTDIYSLAAVAYEMLVGDPPLMGSTAQAVISKVITDRPSSVRAARRSVPEDVALAIDKGLEKLPADRWATASEFAKALSGTHGIAGSSAPVIGRSVEGDRPRRSARGRLLSVAAGCLVAGAIAGSASTWAVSHRATGAPAPRARFVLDDSAMASGIGALSADGSQYAYAATGPGTSTRLIWVRAFNDLLPLPIPGTEGGASPSFSADGKWLAFITRGQLKRIPIAGGSATTIADSVANYTWDGNIVVFNRPFTTRRDGLWMVSAAGGSPELLTQTDSTRDEMMHGLPSLLPGGTAVVFAIASNPRRQRGELAALRLNDRKVIRLGVAGTEPHFVAPGYLVFGGRAGSLFASEFDPRHLRVTGSAIPVLENVARQNLARAIALSPSGTLVYRPARSAAAQLIGFDRKGHAQPVRSDTQQYAYPRFSPDGKRIAVQITDASGTNVWIQDLVSGTSTRLTHDGHSDYPEWSTDGRRVAWRVPGDSGGEIRWQAADGSGAPERLAVSTGSAVMSPTGGFFVTDIGTGTNFDLVTLDSSHRRKPIVRIADIGGGPKISPDGRWLAYRTNTSGRGEVYVRSIGGEGGVHQISIDGADEPAWGVTSQELFYLHGRALVVARIATAPEFTVVRRDTLFVVPFAMASTNGQQQYDVTRDGQRFVVVRDVGRTMPPVVVFGWLDELREKMALAAKK